MPNFIQTEPVNPIIDEVVKLVLNITMALELTIVPLLIYLIANHSKHMHRYKYFLLNNIFWCLFLTTTVWYSKIHFHFPSPCVHFEPVLGPEWFNGSVCLYMFVLGIVNVLGSMGCTILYRLTHAQNSQCRRYFDNTRTFCVYFGLFQLFSSVAFIGSLRTLQITDPIEVRAEFNLRVPHLANMTLPYICLSTGFLTSAISFIAALFLLGFSVFGIGSLIVLYYKLQSNQSSLTGRTLKLQFMLFYALTIQIIDYYLLELFPLIFDCFGFAFGFAHGEAATLIVAGLTSIHSIVDYFCIIFFITPYRRAVFGMARKLVGLRIDRRPSMFSSELAERSWDVNGRRGSVWATKGF